MLIQKVELLSKETSELPLPSEAAIGVATLSGLICKRLEHKMTNIMMTERIRLAANAVIMLEAQRIKACSRLKLPLGTQPKTMANMEARNATTIA